MFSLTVAFAGGQWALMFNDRETADKAFDNAIAGASVVDDFGQVVQMNKDKMIGILLEDLDQSKMAAIERALHMARVQAKGNEMANADSTLRAARYAQGGPAMINPMGMPGNGRGF